jgi:hypothetical protein
MIFSLLTLSTRTKPRDKDQPCTPQISEEAQELHNLSGRRELGTMIGTINSMEPSLERLHLKNKNLERKSSTLRDKLNSLDRKNLNWLKFWNLRDRISNSQCNNRIPKMLM